MARWQFQASQFPCLQPCRLDTVAVLEPEEGVAEAGAVLMLEVHELKHLARSLAPVMALSNYQGIPAFGLRMTSISSSD